MFEREKTGHFQLLSSQPEGPMSQIGNSLWDVLRKKGVKGGNMMYCALTSTYEVVKAKVKAGCDLTE